MSVLVIYESKAGSTKQYAEWIAAELGTEPVPLAKVRPEQFSAAQTVIFGGCVRGSIIEGAAKAERLAKKHAPAARYLCFAVGIRPDTPRTAELLRKNNFFKGQEPEFYYLPGRLDKAALKQGDRTMLIIYRAMIKRRNDLPEEEAEVLLRLQAGGNYTSREAIGPLLEAARR